jgi:hypothetical protein
LRYDAYFFFFRSLKWRFYNFRLHIYILFSFRRLNSLYIVGLLHLMKCVPFQFSDPFSSNTSIQIYKVSSFPFKDNLKFIFIWCSEIKHTKGQYNMYEIFKKKRGFFFNVITCTPKSEEAHFGGTMVSFFLQMSPYWDI